MTEDPEPTIAIVIPAAGASTRMRGRDKLLERVDDELLIARQIRIACATNLPVLVTLPPDNPARRKAAFSALAGQASAIDIPDAKQGLSASIRAGAGWAQAQGAAGLLIFLPDLPDIQTSDLSLICQRFRQNPDMVTQSVDENGAPGHPTILPQRLFPALQRLNGDCGARAILQGEDILRVTLQGFRATTDLDTPEDWENWRQIRKI